MNNEVVEEKKKSKIGLVIILIILLLLILFAVWFFLIRDKGDNTSNNGTNNTEEKDKPTDKETVEYNYTNGVLTAILDDEGKPVQTDFVIDGLILVGNRHSYDSLEAGAEGIMTKLVEQGYKKDGLNSSFYLNEWIEFYIDTKYEGNNDDIKILITPHKTVEEYLKMSYSELETLASEKGTIIEYKTPDAENYKYVNNGYVNMDYPEGKYDILFIYKAKLAYYINIDLTKEPE